MARKKPMEIVERTTVPTFITKPESWLHALQQESLCFFPGKDEWRQALIHTMLTYFEDEEVLLIEDFLQHYRIPRQTFYKWTLKYDDLRFAFSEVKLLIGARRRKGCFKNSYHYQSSYRDMHCYDYDWSPQVDNYHAELKKQEQSNSGNVTVIMEKFPSPKEKE